MQVPPVIQDSPPPKSGFSFLGLLIVFGILLVVFVVVRSKPKEDLIATGDTDQQSQQIPKLTPDSNRIAKRLEAARENAKPVVANQKSDTEYEVKKFTPSEILRSVSLTNVYWKKDGFGSVLVAGFTILNESSHDVFDIEIAASTYGQSGTRLNRLKKTVTVRVRPGESKRVEELNFGFINQQSATCGFDIVWAQISP